MKKASIFIILLVAIVVLAIVNLLLGSVEIPVGDVCRILAGDTSNEIWTNIIWKSRLRAGFWLATHPTRYGLTSYGSRDCHRHLRLLLLVQDLR